MFQIQSRQQSLEQTEHSDDGTEVATALTALSLQNQKRCVLLRLPPELRNAVYEYVFLEDDIEICVPHGEKTHSHGHTHYPKQNLQLLQTCRQIYTEARLLPFASNQFKGSHWALRIITKLFSRDQANAISTIHVLIDDMDIDIIKDKSDARLCLNISEAPSLFVLHWNMLSTLKRLARLSELKQILFSLSQDDCEIWKWLCKNGWAEAYSLRLADSVRQQATRGKEIQICSLVEE